MGAAALHVGAREIRRLLLRGTRYFIYYSVHDADVEVLRLWHVSRGARPKL
jgi:plasmid stabilization system protein ParE